MPITSENSLAYIRITMATVLRSFFSEKHLYTKLLCEMESVFDIKEPQEKLCFTSSGRAALSMVFGYLRRRSNNPVDTVLLPDYICNVVSVAAEYAGLHVKFYQTVDYTPCMDSVERLLSECGAAGILFASMMGHCSDHNALYEAVRANHPNTAVIFDECQNFPGGVVNPLLSRDDVYYVISFNNKMMQGILGGAVYGLPHEACVFEARTPMARSLMQLNVAMAYIRQNFRSLLEYMTGNYHAPDEAEKSDCDGKYCVVPYPIYKISLSAAYLGLRNWAKHKAILTDNARTLFNGNDELLQVSAGNNTVPLYIPVALSDALIGKYPLKGKYWTRVPCPQYGDHIYIVVPSTIRLRNKQQQCK